MALSGLDIYKMLPKTNCKECGFSTCLAFAMQLAKKAASIESCPYVSPQTKAALEAASQPPIRLVTLGSAERPLELGNETVLFRHEEKFRNPCGIGFILKDTLGEPVLKKRLEEINALSFERIGQVLSVNCVAVKQTGPAATFLKAVELVAGQTKLALVLMSNDSASLSRALEITRGLRPLIFSAEAKSVDELARLAKTHAAALVVPGKNIDEVSELAQRISSSGFNDLVLDTGAKRMAEKIWDLTQLRRLALKRNLRSLGYPSIAVISRPDPYEEVMEAATYILKYGSLVLLEGSQTWQALSLLTLRQNIYSDPQKPLQIEPKVYAIGQAGRHSPVLVTTNFSLTYYTVVGEVEASKVPSYIVSIDTEGMSVLTAWAAEKFTPEKIAGSLKKFGAEDLVAQKNLIIPGYVAVMSGDLEEQSGWKVTVGPKEAAGLPSFLKNM